MRAAIWQSDTAGLEPAERLERLGDVARDTDAELLLCPELFMSGYAVEDDIRRHAERSDGPFADAVTGIARTTGTAIVYGYPEAEGDAIYNAVQSIDASGRRLANHRKLVLPPGFESNCFTAGDGIVPFDLHGIRFGLLICYDAEFPEAVRAMAQDGAQVVLVPTALGSQWAVVANRVIPSRAFENGAYVLYANHAGREGALRYLGASCIVGPDGVDLARAGDAEAVIVAEIDPARVAIARRRLPYLRDLAALSSRLPSTGGER